MSENTLKTGKGRMSFSGRVTLSRTYVKDGIAKGMLKISTSEREFAFFGEPAICEGFMFDDKVKFLIEVE